MPVLNGKELRIVGFLCNWCSYGGADTAGVARATQPTDLRIIRVPCSGRIDPLFIVRALLNGADGVLVSGCHPRDCHYSAGNYYARRRLEVLKQFLPVLGIDERRFEYTWVSASEGQRWQHVVTTFTDRIHKLGPAPRFEDPEPLLKVVDMALTSLRPQGQLGRRAGGAFHRGGRTGQGVGQLGRGHGAAVAFALGAFGHAEAVFLAVGGDGHAGLVIDHAVDLVVAAQFLVHAGHVQGAFAGHGEDGHVVAVDEVSCNSSTTERESQPLTTMPTFLPLKLGR